jgi:hypothetical protein
MKVICIIKCKFQTFTIEPGEWLEVEDNYPLTYQFERNGRQWVWKDRFITLEQWRDKQLNKLT